MIGILINLEGRLKSLLFFFCCCFFVVVFFKYFFHCEDFVFMCILPLLSLYLLIFHFNFMIPNTLSEIKLMTQTHQMFTSLRIWFRNIFYYFKNYI